MAKLTIRTIELELESGILPDLARSVIQTAVNGHVGGPFVAEVPDAAPARLDGPATELTASEPKQRKKYTRRAATNLPEVPADKPRLGRPPKVRSEEPASEAPVRGGLSDQIETLMIKAGRSINTVYLAQRLPGIDLSNIKRALGQGCRHKRFVHDSSDDTYSLADVR